MTPSGNHKNIFIFLPWVLSFILLFPWAYLQFNTSVNSDVAWLSICAERLLNGGTLSGTCFDTNPPLNVLIYTPPILLSQLIGIKLYHSIFILTLALIALSTYGTNKILTHMDFLNPKERQIFLFGFLASITILTNITYAERDHVIALGLLPFVLIQFAITRKIKLPRKILIPVLILGTLAILIKPHFGLLPTIILLNRMILQKRLFSIIKDLDFIILAVMSASYIAITIIIFPDFLTVILPDVLNFYLHYNNPSVVYPRALKYGLFLIACITIPFLITEKDDKTIEMRKFLLTLFFGAFICLLVFVIQMKGFYYHLLPMLTFIVPALSLGLYKNADKILSKTPLSHSSLILYLLTSTIFIGAYIKKPLLPNYPTHKEYENAPLTQFIKKECQQPCSFFITHENMDIISQIAFYTGYPYATRFPSYWFIPGFNLQTSLPDKIKQSAAYQEKIKEAHKRYAEYVVQDLEHYNPSLLLILQNPPHTPKKDAFDYFDVFSLSPRFQEITQEFEKTGEFKTDRAYFYKNTKYDYEYMLTWDVYKKKIPKNQ